MRSERTSNNVKEQSQSLNLRVLGSGGSVSIPRPFCGCKNCRRAREEMKGNLLGQHYSLEVVEENWVLLVFGK